MVTGARIAIGPAGIVPFLSEKGSALLVSQSPSQEAWHAASEAILEEAHFRTSKHRATAEYRQEMVRSQLVKVLAKAAERAEGGKAIPEGVGQ